MILLFARAGFSQSSVERPVPILMGNSGFIANVHAGQTDLLPAFNPILLIPAGDQWLVEARGSFKGDFERAPNNGPYGGQVDKEIDYLQLDYIANPYVTVTVGRFLTPFGIYNERLYPLWIRDLQVVPLIFPIGTGSSDGLMFRGGFRATCKANLNYATYFSTLSTVEKFDSDRLAGGRIGIFLPASRVEVGTSFQKSLQDDRKNSLGLHFAWQPPPIPLNLRAEYARSKYGSGYWIEGAYRLSQLRVWRQATRRTEFVARMQQIFKGEQRPPSGAGYTFPRSAVQQPDFGLNYYIRDGLKASASYSRWLGQKNWNIWTVGVACRFAMPLGRTQ